MVETCGDYGGITADGDPCGRPAGYGTDNQEGICRDHVDTINQEIKKEYLEILKNDTVSFQEAARRIDRDQSTVWRWRQNDEEFDEQVSAAKEQQRTNRVQAMEDAAFQQAIRGDAAASLFIYLLKVWGGERYKQADKKVVEEQGEKTVDHQFSEEKIDRALAALAGPKEGT